MDIMELGAIGELVGGVAVIGSLIYVGFQLRQNSDQARQRNAIERAHAAREVTRDFNEIYLTMRDPQLVKLFRQGTIDFDRLPPNDQATLHVWLTAYLLHAISTFLVGRDHLVDEGYAERWMNGCASLVKSPGINSWWNQRKHFFHEDFVSHIDRLIAMPTGPEPMHLAFPWFGPDEARPEEA